MEENKRDYDVESLKPEFDARLERTKHEAVFAVGLYVIMVALVIIFSYMLCPKNAEDMTYVLGIPAWFFTAALIEIVVFIIAMVYNWKFSRSFSLDARDEEEKDV